MCSLHFARQSKIVLIITITTITTVITSIAISDVREFITVTSEKSGIEDEILSLTVSFRGLRGKLHETIPNTSTMKAKDLKKLVQKSKHDMTNNFFSERREQAEKLWREGRAEHANKRHRAR